MRDLGITDISRTHGVLETVCNYHFLAKGKENVARHLSAELAEMEKSGRIAEITRETLARLFPGYGREGLTDKPPYGPYRVFLQERVFSGISFDYGVYFFHYDMES